MMRALAMCAMLSSLSAAATLPKAGPEYRAPKADVPARFGEPGDGVTSEVPLQRWWSVLRDTELDNLIERAVKANLDLKIAASRTREARASRRMTRADLLPSVQSSNSIEHLRGGLTQGVFHPGSNGNGQSSLIAPYETSIFQFGFDASWEIDFFGGRRRALEAATAEVAVSEESRRDTLVSLLAEVARNYSELRGTERRLDITQQNIQLQADSLELARVRADAGLGTQLDVEREKAQLASTQATVPALESQHTEAIHRLSVLLGERPDGLLSELRQHGPMPAAPPVIPAGLPADLLKRRPDIRRADAEVAAATARVGVARSDLFPKFTLTGTQGRQGTDFSGLTFGAGNFFAVGPGIKLPLFTGGKIRANIEAHKLQLEQAELQYQSVVLRSLQEVEDAITAYSHERERREKLAAAVDSSKLSALLATELYTRGLSDFLSVLDAQRQQLSAEDELVRSETLVVTNLVALYKALGGGWEAQ